MDTSPFIGTNTDIYMYVRISRTTDYAVRIHMCIARSRKGKREKASQDRKRITHGERNFVMQLIAALSSQLKIDALSLFSPLSLPLPLSLSSPFLLCVTTPLLSHF
jgi:hypothetical protein